MSDSQRILDTEVEHSVAVLPDAPKLWTYSTLKDVETCALRFSLATASFPDLWIGYGYPRAPHPSALFGDVVHDALEQIVRALVAAGCTTLISAEAVAVLRGVGGYSAVATAAVERRMMRLQDNPRLSVARRQQIQRQLEDRVPEARVEIQARLRRIALVPRPNRSAYKEQHVSDGRHERHALGTGTYAEVLLRADELRVKGRLDLLTITADRVDIADHKTGLEDASHLDQLRFYGALWEHDLVANAARTPLGELTVAYPTSDVTIKGPDRSELEGITESIRARVREADERIGVDAPVATTGMHCLLCPVRSICAAYWGAMTQDPSEIPPRSWFDFEGIVGAQNGAKSWWMLAQSSSNPVLLLRTTSAQVGFTRGQRIRFLGLRREDDPDIEMTVATLTTASEMFVMSSDATP